VSKPDEGRVKKLNFERSIAIKDIVDTLNEKVIQIHHAQLHKAFPFHTVGCNAAPPVICSYMNSFHLKNDL